MRTIFRFTLLLLLGIFIDCSPVFSQTKKTKYDVAFVLRGYENSSEYVDSLDFVNSANVIMGYLNQLSFGSIATYRIFSAGADERSPIYLQSLRDIDVINAALGGWQGSQWDWLRNRTDYWSVIPDAYLPKVKAALDWMKLNKKDFTSYQDTKLISPEDYSLIRNNIVGKGVGSGQDFLINLKMPEDYNPDDFLYTQVVLNSKSKSVISGGGAQSTLNYFGILDSKGNPYPANKLSKANFVYFSPRDELRTGGGTFVSVHEGVHALGMGTHDVDGLERDLSVMSSFGSIESFSMLPAWDRYFWTKWLPQSTITTDSSQVADLYNKSKPADAQLKYIYEVKKGDNLGRGGTYMEKYKKQWYSYTVDAMGTLTFTSPFKNRSIEEITTILFDVPENIKVSDTVSFYVRHDGQSYSNLMGYKFFKDDVEIKSNDRFSIKGKVLTINGVSKQDQGYYSVKVTNQYGSMTSSKLLFRIKCDPPNAPTALPNLIVCQNAPAPTLQATASANSQLLWYQTNDFTEKASTSPFVLSTAKTGDFNYYVSQRDNINLCESPKTKISLTIKAQPQTPEITLDDQYNLKTTGLGLTWYLNGSAIKDTTNTLKSAAFGLYTVKSTVNGCSSLLSQALNYVITGKQELEKAALIVYPNPYHDKLIIKLNEDFLGEYYVDVFDVQGKNMFNQSFNQPEIELNLSFLPAGGYNVKITSLDGLKTFVHHVVRQ